MDRGTPFPDIDRAQQTIDVEAMGSHASDSV
jgi:hypothetical protein